MESWGRDVVKEYRFQLALDWRRVVLTWRENKDTDFLSGEVKIFIWNFLTTIVVDETSHPSLSLLKEALYEALYEPDCPFRRMIHRKDEDKRKLETNTLPLCYHAKPGVPVATQWMITSPHCK